MAEVTAWPPTGQRALAAVEREPKATETPEPRSERGEGR